MTFIDFLISKHERMGKLHYLEILDSKQLSGEKNSYDLSLVDLETDSPKKTTCGLC